MIINILLRLPTCRSCLDLTRIIALFCLYFRAYVVKIDFLRNCPSFPLISRIIARTVASVCGKISVREVSFFNEITGIGRLDRWRSEVVSVLGFGLITLGSW